MHSDMLGIVCTSCHKALHAVRICAPCTQWCGLKDLKDQSHVALESKTEKLDERQQEGRCVAKGRSQAMGNGDKEEQRRKQNRGRTEQ